MGVFFMEASPVDEQALVPEMIAITMAVLMIFILHSTLSATYHRHTSLCPIDTDCSAHIRCLVGLSATWMAAGDPLTFEAENRKGLLLSHAILRVNPATAYPKRGHESALGACMKEKATQPIFAVAVAR